MGTEPLAAARSRAWPPAPVKKPGFRWNAAACVPRNASLLTVAGPRRCLEGVTRRRRKTLEEATRTIDRVQLATRTTATGARDAAEDDKKYVRGVPRAIGIELAPALSTAARCARCAARRSCFFFCRAMRRPATSSTRETFAAERAYTSARSERRVVRARELASVGCAGRHGSQSAG